MNAGNNVEVTTPQKISYAESTTGTFFAYCTTMFRGSCQDHSPAPSWDMAMSHAYHVNNTACRGRGTADGPAIGANEWFNRRSAQQPQWTPFPVGPQPDPRHQKFDALVGTPAFLSQADTPTGGGVDPTLSTALLSTFPSLKGLPVCARLARNHSEASTCGIGHLCPRVTPFNAVTIVCS